MERLWQMAPVLWRRTPPVQTVKLRVRERSSNGSEGAHLRLQHCGWDCGCQLCGEAPRAAPRIAYSTRLNERNNVPSANENRSSTTTIHRPDDQLLLFGSFYKLGSTHIRLRERKTFKHDFVPA